MTRHTLVTLLGPVNRAGPFFRVSWLANGLW